ncbi:hypothetical protein Ddc_22456 [Ditylenchus destructor]|nr:hypothetical protein Ddc_22456 [Ditylenchus destructor]
MRQRLRGQREDGDMDAVAAHPQRGGAGLGQRHDGLAAQVVRGEQRAHRDRLVDAAELAVGEVGVQRHELGVLGFRAIAAICWMVSTGKRPAAVSALSMTASVPSSTALATSDPRRASAPGSRSWTPSSASR